MLARAGSRTFRLSPSRAGTIRQSLGRGHGVANFSVTMTSRICDSRNFSHANAYNRYQYLSTTRSSIARAADDEGDEDGPWGDLFQANIGKDLVGKTASIRRTFDARSNSLGLLTCGGEELARHASFDPEYDRARGWIQYHAVGPAVISPVLLGGLVGCLVEAAFPQSVPMETSMHQIRPLIVGVEVSAKIEVVAVVTDDANDEEASLSLSPCADAGKHHHQEDVYKRSTDGFKVCLRTEVARERDGAPIAKGTHSIWIPDYLHM